MKLQRLSPVIRSVSLAPARLEDANSFARSSTAPLRLRGRALQSRNARIACRDLYTCRACGRVVDACDGQVDHRVPLAFGGSDEDANLQWLCTPCHRSKTERDLAQMRRSNGCA